MKPFSGDVVGGVGELLRPRRFRLKNVCAGIFWGGGEMLSESLELLLNAKSLEQENVLLDVPSSHFSFLHTCCVVDGSDFYSKK